MHTTDTPTTTPYNPVRTMPVRHYQTREVSYWHVYYVGMKVPGAYTTEAHALAAAEAFLADPERLYAAKDQPGRVAGLA